MTLFFLFGGINFGSQFEGYSPWWQGKTWRHGCEASDPIVSTIRKQRRVNPGAWPNFSFYSAKGPRSWFGNSISCQWKIKSISAITAVCSAMSGRFCTVTLYHPYQSMSEWFCTVCPLPPIAIVYAPFHHLISMCWCLRVSEPGLYFLTHLWSKNKRGLCFSQQDILFFFFKVY